MLTLCKSSTCVKNFFIDFNELLSYIYIDSDCLTIVGEINIHVDKPEEEEALTLTLATKLRDILENLV